MISAFEIDWSEPIRLGLISGSASAVTLTFSVTAVTSRLNVTNRFSPRATTMSLKVSVLKPLIFAVTV